MQQEDSDSGAEFRREGRRSWARLIQRDVAMDDALRVGGIQSVGNLNGYVQQLVNWHGCTVGRAYSLPESFAFEQLHSDKGPPVEIKPQKPVA